MIRVQRNRLGTYFALNNKRICIGHHSHRRTRYDFGHIMTTINPSGSGIIPIPTTSLIDSFNSLYAQVAEWGSGSVDFARLAVHTASMLSRRSVLA